MSNELVMFRLANVRGALVDGDGLRASGAAHRVSVLNNKRGLD